MKDIVEELRKIGELQGDTYSSYEILAMIKQARIEIEQLRAAVPECEEGHCRYAQALDAKQAEIERMRALVSDLADDLASEVESHYKGVKDHPAMTPKYERDMANVYRAREALDRSLDEDLPTADDVRGILK